MAGQITVARLNDIALASRPQVLHGLYGTRQPHGRGGTGAVIRGGGHRRFGHAVSLGEHGKRRSPSSSLVGRPGELRSRSRRRRPLPVARCRPERLRRRAEKVIRRHTRRPAPDRRDGQALASARSLTVQNATNQPAIWCARRLALGDENGTHCRVPAGRRLAFATAWRFVVRAWHGRPGIDPTETFMRCLATAA